LNSLEPPGWYEKYTVDKVETLENKKVSFLDWGPTADSPRFTIDLTDVFPTKWTRAYNERGLRGQEATLCYNW
jgi:hypothetical protein